jgi:hypothetical protein
MVGALAFATALLVVAGTRLAPMSRSCAPDLSPAACEAAVAAVLRRGLPALHPLILAARVEPGSAAGAEELGHRATVTFDLLAVPGSTSVELHSDQGGHWGGRSDRSAAELAAWSLLPLLLASVVGVGAAAWIRRRRAPTAGAAP